MATHQSVLTPTQTFSPSSEITTTWLVGSTTHKLRPRLFWKVCITEFIAGVSKLCTCPSQLHRLSSSSANHA